MGAVAGLGSGITAGRLLGNWTLNRRLLEAEKQLSALKGSLDDSISLWLRPPVRADDYVRVINDSIPIVTIVNLKGGVGKTTNVISQRSSQPSTHPTHLTML